MAAFASTQPGEAAARAGLPLGASVAESEAMLSASAAAAALGARLDFSGVRDVRAALARLRAGDNLPGDELAALGVTLKACTQLAAALAGAESATLAALAPALRAPPPDLAAALARCLSVPGGAVLDAASAELAAVRAQRRAASRELRSLLVATGARLLAERACDAAQVVSRRQRQCVPVRAGMSGLLPGCVVLDASASGATLFVEPREAVPLNNSLAALGQQQEALEEAVLAALSADARAALPALDAALAAVVAADLALARARHGAWAGGARPRFTSADEAPVALRGARHPLLLARALPPPPLRWWELEAAAAAAEALARDAPPLPPPRRGRGASDADAAPAAPQTPALPPPPVPVDWAVPPGCRCVVITGPNTGGKTACMKTLALACLLARAGGFPACGNGGDGAQAPALPWARRVLADLGDAQSLQAGLSTFSGHVARLGRILRALDACAAPGPSCEGVALVLLDEPGGGTDPAEGAALACALLEALAQPHRGALAVATSHYDEAKQLCARGAAAGSAADAGAFVNAAVEFDAAALAPTYRLLWGVSGESYALEVATALGLPAPVLAAAAAALAGSGTGGGARREARGAALGARLREQLAEAQAAAAAAAEARRAAAAEAAALRERAAALLPGEEALAAGAEAEAEAAQAAARAALAACAAAPDPAAALAAAVATHLPAGWELAPGGARRVGAPEAPAWVPRPGARVLVERLGTRAATVVAASAAEVEVKLGLLVTRVPLSEVSPWRAGAEAAAAPKAPRMPTPQVSRAAARAADAVPRAAAAGSAADAAALVAQQRPDNTVDVRGMYAHDAVAAVEAAMGAAGRRSGASALFIVHGVGTGRVKSAVLELLRSHALVLRAEPAQQRDGGAGCTIAYLR